MRKIGTFEDIYEDYSDYSLRNIQINAQGIRINVGVMYDDVGGASFSGAMKTRKHWYQRWNSVDLGNLTFN